MTEHHRQLRAVEPSASAHRPREARELGDYLTMLTRHAQAGQFVDVRWGRPAGPMRRRFIPASRILSASSLIRRLARECDVYLGVALRDGCTLGGRSAVSGSRLLYVECDVPEAVARAAALACPPSLRIASGTPGHAHLYWQLRELVSPVETERVNRGLAGMLGGDPACTDIARILRPPATLNHKHDPPSRVRVTAHEPHLSYTLAELTRILPPDPAEGPAERARTPRRGHRGSSELDTWLLRIPAAEYVAALSGRAPNRAGKVLCPFHSERVPSLQLYPDGTFYCFASGCGRGGTIFDFAAHLWLSDQSGSTLRGRRFIEVRERLAALLLSDGSR